MAQPFNQLAQLIEHPDDNPGSQTDYISTCRSIETDHEVEVRASLFYGVRLQLVARLGTGEPVYFRSQAGPEGRVPA